MIGLLAVIGGIIGSAAIAPLIAVCEGTSLKDWWRS